MSILKKPVVTEKYTDKGETLNQYGFIVTKDATKQQIKSEVERLYNVAVTSVNTMIYAGKRKTKYTKRNIIKGKRSGFKKAVITVKEGDIIDFYSNI
jgi:large subunit ribosomal protein L23